MSRNNSSQLKVVMLLKLRLATASSHRKHPWAAKVMVLTLAYPTVVAVASKIIPRMCLKVDIFYFLAVTRC